MTTRALVRGGRVALGLWLAIGSPARAEELPPVPASAVLPRRLDLETSLQVFRTHGLDLIIADANVLGAEGARRSAGAVANPVVSVGVGAAFGPLSSTSSPALSAQVSDGAAVADLFVGKRRLRIDVADRALEAARLDRRDAQRTLEAQVKSQVLQAVVAKMLLGLLRDTLDTFTKTLELTHNRYAAGDVSEVDVLRIQTEKLQAEDAVDSAERDFIETKVALAYLLGVRQLGQEFDVDETLLDRRAGPRFDAFEQRDLLSEAIAQRPDLASARRRAESARASVALARRSRFPDLSLWASYSNSGFGATASQPPTGMIGLSAPLPVFYQGQGEIVQAQADVVSGTVSVAKVEAQVVSDVMTALATLRSARRRLERMDASLLVSARRSRDLVAAMYGRGAASLLEMLDAQRTFLTIDADHVQASGEYWSAVFGIEQAIGKDLR